MAEKTCETCRFFVAKASGIGVGTGGRAEVVTPGPSRCHAHAPTVAGWPLVAKDDWCGEYKPSRDEMLRAAREAMERGLGNWTLTCPDFVPSRES